MTPCDAVARALAAGGPLPEPLRAHADGCPSCRALVALDASLRRAEPPAPLEPSAALRAALARDHVPAPRYSALRRALPALVFATLLVFVTLAFVPRPDLARQPSGYWAVAALWAAGVVFGLGALLRRGTFGTGWNAPARWTYSVLGVLAFELFAWAVPSRGIDPVRPFWPAAVPCVVAGLAVAVALGAVVFHAGRRTAAAAPGAAGAVGGVAAGLAGGLVLHLHCGIADPTHVGLAHGAAVVVGALAGALVGRRVLVP